jgi:hypothetical protein
MILEPILSRVGFPLVADVPGVGEHLGNDGVVILALERPAGAAVNPNKDDLYAGGAFTPYPKADANPDNPFQVTKFTGCVWCGDLVLFWGWVAGVVVGGAKGHTDRHIVGPIVQALPACLTQSANQFNPQPNRQRFASGSSSEWIS